MSFDNLSDSEMSDTSSIGSNETVVPMETVPSQLSEMVAGEAELRINTTRRLSPVEENGGKTEYDDDDEEYDDEYDDDDDTYSESESHTVNESVKYAPVMQEMLAEAMRELDQIENNTGQHVSGTTSQLDKNDQNSSFFSLSMPQLTNSSNTFREYQISRTGLENNGTNFRSNRCFICMESFTPMREMPFTSCGHCFHEDCLRVWLCSRKNCPLCRHPLG